MKIAKIDNIANKYYFFVGQNKKIEENNRISTNPILNSYRDFNINFRGRTPENFYAQEFNINSMPLEMKKYLYADYENRKHIPPEQVMNEVFKYISIANNVEDVKKIYTEEGLFSNLHEAVLKNRSGILSDIRIAKELENAPLLKEPNMDFGVYLLNKIYTEGKTIREINKDFYEKDLNPVYKGVVTQPITYGTTSAYGIRYPKQDFWNSFIATRDEYKKFFVENMPKMTKDVKPEKMTGTNRINKNETEQDISKRTYRLKSYKKRALKNDIKSAKGNKLAIEKAVIKRFTKDDPEASFIVKYLSPIMTVAADRIHLSEEMKDFVSVDKLSHSVQDDYMFTRFWKANPFLLEQYSTAITDSIELFEETYGGGGNLAINNEFKIVDNNTENKKVIDFIPLEFKQLLEYAQNIVPAREAKYKQHDELQEAWNKHFEERYGSLNVGTQIINDTEKQIVSEKPSENYIILKDINGNEEKKYLDLEKSLKEYYKKLANNLFPTKALNIYLKEVLKNPLCNELYKMSIALRPYKDKIQDKYILTNDEINKVKDMLDNEFSKNHQTLLEASDFAICETLSKEFDVAKIYRYRFGFPTHADNEYNAKSIVINNEQIPILQKEIDALYENYTKPLSNADANKIGIFLIDYISKIDTTKTICKDSVLYNQALINDFLKIAHTFTGDKNYRKHFKNLLAKTATLHPSVKTILAANSSKEQQTAKIEATLTILIRALFDRSTKLTKQFNNDEQAVLLGILRELKMARSFARI